MRTFLGVDGGGTKTDFLLIDETGRVLATRREGSAYYLEIGLEALQSMLTAGIKDLLQSAGVAPASTFAFLGLPAYGENRALLGSLDRIVADVLPLECCRCGNDVICGWAGALAGGDGINIVAGTGSIAYGEIASCSARAGGWGELFSDEGSAYWVAREALTLFSRMSDGRISRGPLYALVRDHFGVSADLEVCAAVYGPPPLTRSEVSALAPIAATAARAGDLATRRIFETAAQELASIVHAVRDNLEVPPQQCVPLSYSGGMCRADNLILPLLKTALQATPRQYDFAAPRLSPIAGAVLYAAKLAGAPLKSDAIAQLSRTHAAFRDAP